MFNVLYSKVAVDILVLAWC